MIETKIDKLLSLVNKNKKISISDAAQKLAVDEEQIEEWAISLSNDNLIKLVYPTNLFESPYLQSLGLVKKEKKKKIKKKAKKVVEKEKKYKKAKKKIHKNAKKKKLIILWAISLILLLILLIFIFKNNIINIFNNLTKKV